MKRKIFLCVLFLWSFADLTRAQSVYYLSLEEFYKQFNTYEHGRKIGGESEVVGSPYVNESFISGNILTRPNILYVEIPLRYNIYTDEMEYRFRDGRIFAIGRPEIIDTVFISNDKYVYIDHTAGKKNLKGYFKVLIEGQPALLQKMNVSIRPAEPPGAYKELVPPAFERKKDDFFLEVTTDELFKITDKKDIIALWRNYTAEINQFIKSNGIKFNNPDDMIRLITYCHSLEKN